MSDANADGKANPNEPTDAAAQLLSALTDGELDADGCARSSKLWAGGDGEGRYRSTWHSYQLIGDVLRSEHLAQAPAHDEAFLQRLRLRLADEPAVVAPTASVSALPVRTRSRRMLPMALAAGVMGLGAALVVVQWSNQPPAQSLAAAAPAPPMPVAPNPASAGPAQVAAGGQLVRDARLDRYLRAHREYGSAAPVSLPGGAARTVETVSFQP